MSSTACPVCSFQETLVKEHGLSRCGDCSHIFQTDQVANTGMYDASYLQNFVGRPNQAMSRLRANFIEQHLPDLGRGAKVLDIGYGDGSFLKEMERRSYDVYGSDLHGQDVGIRDVDMTTDTTQYDVITWFDSLEHFGENFRLPRRMKGVHWVVSIPYTPSWMLADPKANHHYKPGEHLHYFSDESLDRLMQDIGKVRVAEGYPEDEIRKPRARNGIVGPNIRTAIFSPPR